MAIEKLPNCYVNYWMVEYPNLPVPTNICEFVDEIKIKFQEASRIQKILKLKVACYVYERDIAREVEGLRGRCEKMVWLFSQLHDEFPRVSIPRRYKRKIDQSLFQGEKILSWCNDTIRGISMAAIYLTITPSNDILPRLKYQQVKPKKILTLLRFSPNQKNGHNN